MVASRSMACRCRWRFAAGSSRSCWRITSRSRAARCAVAIHSRPATMSRRKRNRPNRERRRTHFAGALLAQALVSAQAAGGARHRRRARREGRAAAGSGCSGGSIAGNASAARGCRSAADREPHPRIRFLSIHESRGSGGTQASGAEKAFRRSAVQRDGRSRRLHRRLLDAKPARARSREPARARALHARSAADAHQCPRRGRGHTAGGARGTGAARVAGEHARPRASDCLACRYRACRRHARAVRRFTRSRIQMSIARKDLHLCSCNGTMPLDAPALASALGMEAAPRIAHAMCQRELAHFSEGVNGDALVACTQESKLLGEAAEEAGRTHTIHFVNIRESAGWSAQARAATPKIAALLAMAALPAPEPVPGVSYASGGQVLIVGPADAALHWASLLHGQLGVTVLATGRANGSEL